MYKAIPLFFALFWMMSCQSPEDAKSTPEHTIDSVEDTSTIVTTENSADSSVIEEEIVPSISAGELDSLRAMFVAMPSLPFNAGAETWESGIYEEMNYLNGDQVKLLSENLIEHDLSLQSKWDIENFCKIDSLMNNGGYDEYLANLDIGMIEFVDARALYNYPVAEHQEFLIWLISYSTMEACPFASGNVVFGTLIHHNKIAACTVINEEMGGADPPSQMNRSIHGLISPSGAIDLAWKVEYGDEDENGEEIWERDSLNYSLQITPEGSIAVHSE